MRPWRLHWLLLRRATPSASATGVTAIAATAIAAAAITATAITAMEEKLDGIQSARGITRGFLRILRLL